jgi:hypothetical protein
MPFLRADVARALRLGVWMDGFEERRPGVLGGWVDAAGSVLGVEIAIDGEMTVGEYIRDAGAPFVSGRWGFGWTPSRRGFETTDGGMSWTKDIELPDPIASPKAVRARACGPVGCIAAGWLRVGWGGREPPAPPDPPGRGGPPPHAAPALDLVCEALSPKAPEPKRAAGGKPPAPPSLPVPVRPWAGPASSTWGAVAELPACLGRAGPATPADQLGLSIEAGLGAERSPRSGTVACAYAWGPKNGEWDQLGRWQVRWGWPWGGWADVRDSATAAAPWTTLDAARRGFGKAPGAPIAWFLAPGDDPDHALLLARHGVGSTTADVLVVESDRAPVEVTRPGGDPFPDVEAVARVGDRWYFATAQSAGELPAAIVWLVDGVSAREVGRVPRAGLDTKSPVRLARRADGRAVGVVVEGQPEADRPPPQLWVTSLDLETGIVGEPERLAPVDLSDRAVSICTGDDGGWVLDLPYPGSVRVAMGVWTSPVQASLARVRLSRDRACVERLAGVVDAAAATPPPALLRPAGAAGSHFAASVRALDVSILSAHARYPIRCTRP